MNYRRLFLSVAALAVVQIGWGQVPAATPKPATAVKPAAPASKLSRVDEIIGLVKGGFSEGFIITTLQKTNKSIELSLPDMMKLKASGVSENIMSVMRDPSGSVRTEVGPVAPEAPAPANSSAPVSQGARQPPSSDYNSDLAALGCVAEPRKRILAISEFEFGAVKTQIQQIFGTEVDLGKGIMALLTKQLQQDGKYRIVERANLKTLIDEQDKGTGNRYQRGSGPKVGKLIGADAYLMGTIVVFGRDDTKKGVSLGGWVPRIPGGIDIGKKIDKAVVAIAYRLVDAETGEIIDTAQEKGESSRESKSFSIAGLSSKGGGALGVDMTSVNFAQTIIGEATIEVIKNLSSKMSEQQAKVKMRSIEVEGRLAEVSGKRLYITTGSNDGVSKCDRFQISRIVKEVKDPETKEVIDLEVEPIGEMVVTEVRERMAVGAYSGSAAPEVNMAARKIQQPDIPSRDQSLAPTLQKPIQ